MCDDDDDDEIVCTKAIQKTATSANQQQSINDVEMQCYDGNRVKKSDTHKPCFN